MKRAKVLIIVGGKTGHLDPFVDAAGHLDISLTTASFSSLEYETVGDRLVLKVEGEEIDSFDCVYIRLVGKRMEEASLLFDYCRQRGIKLIDNTLPIPKSVEVKRLLEAKVSVPRTYFGSLENIMLKTPAMFGYPFVIKGTTGKQGHAVWSPRDKEEAKKLYEVLKIIREKKRMNFVAQEFIMASQRERIFVIGGRVVAAITRPTRWRKRFDERSEGVRSRVDPIPEDEADLALKAANVLKIGVAGVDIIREDKTGRLFVLEVNSAPRWESIKQDTGVDVEGEILRYLTLLV